MNSTQVYFSTKANVMTAVRSVGFGRRQFLRVVGGVVAGSFGATLTRAHDVPKNANPRAIFGDLAEPDWDQRVTITVGLEQADLVGRTDRVIQAAVDYVARRGGGTVRVLPTGSKGSPFPSPISARGERRAEACLNDK